MHRMRAARRDAGLAFVIIEMFGSVWGRCQATTLLANWPKKSWRWVLPRISTIMTKCTALFYVNNSGEPVR